MKPSRAHDERLDLLAALAAEQPAPLAAWLDQHTMRLDNLAWLRDQGLALFAFQRAQQADLLARVPHDVLAPWQEMFYQATVAAAAMDWEIERVLLALSQAGVDFIWMKGAALAYAVYPNPACRLRGDLDLWIQLEQLPLATAALAALNYRLSAKDDRPDALARLVGGEQQMVPTDQSAALRLIELQWPALRGEWARRSAAVDHQGIWQRRTTITVEDRLFWTMAPEDTLLHLCFHQAINHQFSAPWLRSLLDVHLLLARRTLDWSQVAARAVSWRLAVVVWTVLSLAQRLLASPVPGEVLQAIAPPPWRQRLIDGLQLEEALLAMRPGGYGHRRFLVQLALVDRAPDALAFLGRGVFPEAAWLRARYGLPPDQPLGRWRLAHAWRLATSARA